MNMNHPNTAQKLRSLDESVAAKPVAPDPEAFVAKAQRITNNADVAEAIKLFHPECVAEWVFDGIYARYEGIDAIQRALTATLGVFCDHRLSGRKTLACSNDNTIVNTWRGGFRNRDHQRGTEIWTFRDGRVIHHQMYIYLHLTPRWSILGLLRQLRLVIAAPRVALSQLKHELRGTRMSTRRLMARLT